MAKKFKEIPANQLRWHCDPDRIRVKTTDDAKASKEIIGQERALRALRLGLEMKYPGYNVFVTGFSGTGRMTTIKRLLSEFEEYCHSTRWFFIEYQLKGTPISLSYIA